MPVVFANPPISLSTAHSFTILFAGSYVGSLYISKSARLVFKKVFVRPLHEGEQRAKEYDERWRDDPDVIRARMTAVGLSTVSSCVAVIGLVWKLLGWGGKELPFAIETCIARLGFANGSTWPQTVLPCLITPVLYSGSLFAEFLSGRLPLQRNWSLHRSLLPMITTWQGWRNYIIGPITEEVVFRACTLTVYHMAGASRKKMIFLTPLLFGFAHIHHAWDIFNRYGRTKAAAKRALLATAFQLSYTSLFGFHAAYLFLRTGSIIPPLTSHIFCNLMGLPEIGYELMAFPNRRTAIKMAYILGILGYVYTLKRWTHVEDCLYWVPEGERPMF